jgi:predicted porin
VRRRSGRLVRNGPCCLPTEAETRSARTLWQRRQHDQISYDTPTFSGFTGHFGFSASNATATTNASTSAKPRIWSAAGIYKNGPLALGLAYERHNEFGAVGGSSDDHAWVVSGSYLIAGKVLVGGSYNKQDYDLGAGASVDKKAWHLGAEWFISGPHVVYGAYTRAGDTGGTPGATPGGFIPGAGADTGVEKWMIGYRHNFSKRTDAKLAYVRLNNDSAASYNLMGTVNTGNTAAQSAGKHQDAWVMLLRHAF